MDAVGYIVAQVIGAIGAAALVLVVAAQASVAAGVTKPGGGVTEIGALILEIVLTAGFVLVILASTKRAPRAGAAGHPADARRDPLRVGAAVGRVGQPGPLDRLGAGRRRPAPGCGSTSSRRSSARSSAGRVFRVGRGGGEEALA